MAGFAQSLSGAVEYRQSRLKELDGHVGDVLGGWEGSAGGAYSSAWQQWHRGASEVHLGLSRLAKLVGQAAAGMAATSRRPVFPRSHWQAVVYPLAEQYELNHHLTQLSPTDATLAQCSTSSSHWNAAAAARCRPDGATCVPRSWQCASASRMW